MIAELARACLESAWRRGVVIFLTFGLGLLVTWPAADHYIALRKQQGVLFAEWQDVSRAAEGLAALESKTAGRRAALAKRQARCISPQRLTVFRGQIVELARAADCQIRRVAVGEMRKRPWRKGADPLSEHHSTAEEAAELTTQSLNIAVSGKFANVRSFLERLLALDLLLYARHVTLQPADGDAGEALLEMDCLLFDLSEKAPPKQDERS
jgi:hypothetical protein